MRADHYIEIVNRLDAMEKQIADIRAQLKRDYPNVERWVGGNGNPLKFEFGNEHGYTWIRIEGYDNRVRIDYLDMELLNQILHQANACADVPEPPKMRCQFDMETESGFVAHLIEFANIYRTWYAKRGKVKDD